jgi:hypothetical protein
MPRSAPPTATCAGGPQTPPVAEGLARLSAPATTLLYTAGRVSNRGDHALQRAYPRKAQRHYVAEVEPVGYPDIALGCG